MDRPSGTSELGAREQVFLALQVRLSELYAAEDPQCYSLAESLLLRSELPLAHRARGLQVLSTSSIDPYSLVELALEAVRLIDLSLRQHYEERNVAFPEVLVATAHRFLARAQDQLERYKADPWSSDSEGGSISGNSEDNEEEEEEKKEEESKIEDPSLTKEEEMRLEQTRDPEGQQLIKEEDRDISEGTGSSHMPEQCESHDEMDIEDTSFVMALEGEGGPGLIAKSISSLKQSSLSSPVASRVLRDNARVSSELGDGQGRAEEQAAQHAALSLEDLHLTESERDSPTISRSQSQLFKSS